MHWANCSCRSLTTILRVFHEQRTPYANEPPRISGHFFNYLDDVQLSLVFLGQCGGSRTGGFAPDTLVKIKRIFLNRFMARPA